MKTRFFSIVVGLAVTEGAICGVVDPVTGEPDATDPGVKLWLDADDAATVFQDLTGLTPAADGQPVLRWQDKSLSGIVVTQPNGTANAPQFAAAVPALNNLPAVSFVGGANGDALTSTTGNSTGITGAAPTTVVTVWRSGGFTGQNYQHTFHMGNALGAQSYGHSVSRGANLGEVGNHYWGDGFNSDGRARFGHPSFAISIYDGAIDRWYVDGVFAGERAVALNIGADQLQVGSRLSPFTEGFIGDLAEVIVFDVVLTDAERLLLTDYIDRKYGISGFVPPVEPDSGGVNLSTGEPEAAHPNLALWLDSSDASTLFQDTAGTTPAADGQPVARWDSKATSTSISVQQANGAAQPTFTSSVGNLGGAPAVSFTATTTSLDSTTGNSTGISGADAMLTMVTVWHRTGVSGQNYQHTTHIGNTTCNQAYGHSVSRAGNNGEIGNHYWCAGRDFFDSSAGDTGYLTVSTYDGTTDTDIFYLNGTAGGPHNSGDLNIGDSQLIIGARLAPQTEGLTGDIAEVMIFRGVLSEAERNALGFYVQEKYGLTVEGAVVSAARTFNLTDVEVTPTTVELSWDDFGFGAVYAVESSTDGEIFDLVPGFESVANTTASIPRPADRLLLFRVRAEIVPQAIFEDDFESGAGGWTTGSDNAGGTDWELGMPTNVGPPAANSPDNCYGTNLDATYGVNANVWLRSPPIDLTNVTGATLCYFEWRDIEVTFDAGRVAVLDASDDSEIAVLAEGIEGSSGGWQKVTRALPAAALGKTIRIEWRLQSDSFGNLAGWYIDDVEVTVP